jgi:hypothetical protein
MAARSMTRSNVRPDTLMQDPHPTVRRKPLATRGRTTARAHDVENAVDDLTQTARAADALGGLQIRLDHAPFLIAAHL